MTVDEQLQILRRATTEIISEADLRKKLESGRKLRVKLGVDPTAKDVTLGWAVVLRKLRDFQRCGHQAVLVVGDFTAQIGDPSGKSKTRKQLTREEVQVNVDAVLTQFGKILDLQTLEIRYNSEWLGTMGFVDVIRMCAKTTVARIMERDDFTKRWEAHQPISMHELMYPLCQATDSVALKADVELGGNDQKFNNLMGRQLQEAEGQEPQTVVLSPLLVGTDGKEKMSQSLGNYVSIQDTPNDMFGKTMSIPDDLIRNWFELCTDVPMKYVSALCDNADSLRLNPRDLKRRLACHIVDLYHPSEPPAEKELWLEGGLPGLHKDGKVWYQSTNSFVMGTGPNGEELMGSFGHKAVEADTYFRQTFSKRQQPVEAEEKAIPAELGGEFPLASLIGLLGMTKSNGEARRMIEQGGVSLDGTKVSDAQIKVLRSDVVGKVLRVGKHQFAKLA